MKYIMLEMENEGLIQKIPIIFPDVLVHADMEKALIGNLPQNLSKAKSAGYFKSVNVRMDEYSYSDTLDLHPSRKDETIINNWDKKHGLIFED